MDQKSVSHDSVSSSKIIKIPTTHKPVQKIKTNKLSPILSQFAPNLKHTLNMTQVNRKLKGLPQ